MGLPALTVPPAVLVLCSCPDELQATEIARKMVQEGLAACVSRLPPMASVYRWQGQLCEASEQLLLIKTTAAAYAALEMRLKALHPYEMPEIIALPVVAGSEAYLNWVARAVDSNAETNP
jgi:periplasmic divalent cation tolerance protein